MAQQTGPNDPCPCGSGKKYKHCCLPKDRGANRFAPELGQLAPAPSVYEMQEANELESARDSSAPAFIPKTTPETPVAETEDAMNEFWNRFWDDFESADYEGQLSLFHHTIDEGIMDGVAAFEMLTSVRETAVERDERARFGELIARLRQELPAVYEKERAYFISWEISDALVGEDEQALLALAPDLAEAAADNIDVVNPIFDALAYHGKLEILVQAMRTAWPDVRDGSAIMDWGIAEFASNAADFELILMLEQDLTLDPENQQLLARLDNYVETINMPDFRIYVSLITGRETRKWMPEDFFVSRGKSRGEIAKEERDVFVANLRLLGFEFLGYLRHELNVPYSRAELARRYSIRYVLQRLDGELGAKETYDGAPKRKRRPLRKRRSKRDQQKPANILVPSYDTLDRFLVKEFFGFLTFLPHQAVAMFNHIPDWLDFLEKKGLATAEQRKNSLESLSELNNALLRILDHPEDPTLVEPLLHWRENADI